MNEQTIIVHDGHKRNPTVLNRAQYDALCASGMMWEFHPDAPLKWPYPDKKTAPVPDQPTATATPRTDDITGNAVFYAWFTGLFPEPKKSKHQRSNWAYKRDTAHLGWCAAEAHHKAALTEALAEGARLMSEPEARDFAMAECNKLRAEMAELREDKVRLDWLEANQISGKGHRPQEGIPDSYVYTFVSKGWPTSREPKPTVRAAIDAARKEGA